MTFVYLPGAALSPAELSAARLDGHLSAVGEGFMPTDAPETAAHRVAVAAQGIPSALALCRQTAAWVHGAGSMEPAVRHVQRVGPRRLRIDLPRGVLLHDLMCPPEDLVTIGGIAVTGVCRTLSDLARLGEDAALLEDLAHLHPETLPEAVAELRDAHRRPGRRRALAALERLYEEVTR